MRFEGLMIAGFGGLLLAASANAGESTTEFHLQDPQSNISQPNSPVPDEDLERQLEEIIVTEESLSAERLPNTGRVNIQPIPVRISHSRPVLTHTEVELIVRPVRLGEDGVYVSDAQNRRSFARVQVSLNHEGVVPGSRIRRPDLGERALDLPQGIYAITEIRYGIGSNRGAGFIDGFGDGPIHPITHRFCLAEQTIAFDVKNGETTDLGRLVIHGLERHYRKSKFGYRPFLGADANFGDVSDPDFRNKAPEQAAAAAISFDPDNGLCRKKSRRTAGWYTPEELDEAIPNLVLASNSAED